jgi:prepilin signal peptidase PulO-like enzyme (type II secretory pathway)
VTPPPYFGRAFEVLGHSHLVLLVLFAFFVSLVFATLTKDEPHEQVRFGVLLFGGFVVSALVLGWVMYPFPL